MCALTCFCICILYTFLTAFHLFTRTFKKTLILKQKISFICAFVIINQSKLENLIYSYYCFNILENNNKCFIKLLETLNDMQKKTNKFKKIKPI